APRAALAALLVAPAARKLPLQPRAPPLAALLAAPAAPCATSCGPPATPAAPHAAPAALLAAPAAREPPLQPHEPPLVALSPPLQPHAPPLAARPPPLGPPAAPRPTSRPSCSLRATTCSPLAAPCCCLPCSLRCPAPARPAYCTAMASLRVLAFDQEGRPIQFDAWLVDL
ncbi:unnamed protein product, partial [Closterium sp. NIES-54]